MSQFTVSDLIVWTTVAATAFALWPWLEAPTLANIVVVIWALGSIAMSAITRRRLISWLYSCVCGTTLLITCSQASIQVEPELRGDVAQQYGMLVILGSLGATVIWSVAVALLSTSRRIFRRRAQRNN